MNEEASHVDWVGVWLFLDASRYEGVVPPERLVLRFPSFGRLLRATMV